MNSFTKRFLKFSSELNDIFDIIDSYESNIEIKWNKEEEKVHSLRLKVDDQPSLKSLENIVTPFAFEKLIQEYKIPYSVN